MEVIPFLKKLGKLKEARWSAEQARRYPHCFTNVAQFVMFIGFPRSSHSLIGSLLDAHPEACIAHEVDVLKYVHANFSSHQIFHLLLENAIATGQKGREETGYSYHVPGQYQGQYTHLKVIGDKRGGNSSRRLKAHPKLLHELKQRIGKPLRMIHISRNPFDNIATMAYRDYQGPADQIPPSILKQTIDHYLELAQVVEQTRQQLNREEFNHLKIEDFLDNPDHELRQLCHFTGLPAQDDYIDACTSILYDKPRESRWKISWPEHLIEYVQQQITKYPCLQDYEFN